MKNVFLDKSMFGTEGAIFMGSRRIINESNIALYGVPYDGTTSFRPGTRFGPNAIREVSNGIESYCPQFQTDLSEISYVDLGELTINYGAPEPVITAVKNATINIQELGLKPLMLGGEHSITVGAVSAISEFHPNLILVQLDAHADLRHEWLGNSHSHACAMRRCLEVLPSNQLIQFGIRSGTREEFEEMNTYKRLIPHRAGKDVIQLENALAPFKGSPIYLTIDLDWFDPSIMPGTGTPEPGGFYWDDFAAVLNILKKHKIAGADIVELAPTIDLSGISSILAAKVTRSLLMLLNLNNK